MIGKIFKYFVMGVAALIAISLGLWAVGLAIGLAMLAIKVGVVVLIGYGVVKLVTGSKKPKTPEISAEDKKWLES